MDTDRIEKKILLRAKQSRVWEALTDSTQFGLWFGAKLEGPFRAGATIRGAIAPSTDPETGKTSPYDGMPMEWVIDRIEPQRLFSFRWHPHAIERGADYSSEPMTLVTFTLEETGEGVLLTVTESGFDGIPLARRALAIKSNERGWAIQVERIGRYVARAS